MKFTVRPFPARCRHAASATAPALAALVALAAAAGSALATDISYYGVAKGILFNQTSAGLPVIRTGLPYAFQALVFPSTNLITSARIRWSIADLALTPITTPNALGFIQRVGTQDALDATFPNGDFQVVMQTINDGSHTGNLSLFGNNYPSPPFLQNYSAAQAINPSFAFALEWGAFPGGTANDFIFVQVENSQGRVFSTGASPRGPGALNGTATSAVIPANVLQSGHAYIGRIAFFKFSALNESDYPGALGTGGYFTQTDFYLKTSGVGDTTPPALISTSPVNGATGVPINAPVVFQFNEQMNRGFALGISGTSASRSFDWSPDSRVLVATPTSTWPPNTTISWTLNLYYTQLAFGDTNANPLPMETVLTFTTGASADTALPPVLSDARRLPNGRFQFLVSGQNYRTYTVQASTNLVQWTSVATNVAFSGGFQYLDTNAPAHPRRFYRAFGR